MSARRRVVLALASLCLCLGAAEGGLRLFERRFTWRPLPPFGEGPRVREWAQESERQLGEHWDPVHYTTFDAVLGWTTRPGFVSKDGRIHVNAAGLRATSEYAATPPSGVRRIAVCGESFTFGEEVADEEVWAARMEALSGDLEVLNYGVGGYGTDQAYLRVSREARGPLDALLVGVMIENIGRNVNRYRPLWYPSALPAAKPRYVLVGTELVLVPQPFATQAEFVSAVKSGTALARLAEHEYWSESYVPRWLEGSFLARVLAARTAYAARELRRLWTNTAAEPFQTTLALLSALRRTAQDLAARHFLVLVFPTREDLAALLAGRDRYWHTLTDALAASGFDALDLTDALLDAARADPSLALFGKSHFTAAANDLVARAILAHLAQASAFPGPK
jgi:hypothetical protein